MRKVGIPKLDFSNWYSWENRKQYPLKNCPGIYLIAISNKNIEGKTPCFSNVRYIGMTNSKGGLRSRWSQFHNSIRGGEGHGPGKRIFRQKGHYNKWTEKLYVSAMGIPRDEDRHNPKYYIKRGWVAYLEQEALANFHEVVGDHPKYNKQ